MHHPSVSHCGGLQGKRLGQALIVQQFSRGFMQNCRAGEDANPEVMTNFDPAMNGAGSCPGKDQNSRES